MCLGGEIATLLTAVSYCPSTRSTSHRKRWTLSTTMSHPCSVSVMMTWDTGDHRVASVMPRQSMWTAVTSCVVGGAGRRRCTQRASDVTARFIGAARSRARCAFGLSKGTFACKWRHATNLDNKVITRRWRTWRWSGRWLACLTNYANIDVFITMWQQMIHGSLEGFFCRSSSRKPQVTLISSGTIRQSQP